jgi:hypothetical protein
MATPSEILTKKKAKDTDDKKGSDKKGDDAPKKNALIDFIAKHKKPTK